MHLSACNKSLVFAVINDDFVEHARIFHGLTHKIAALYVAAVVGECDGTGRSHTAHSGKFFPFKALGKRADDIDLDETFLCNFIFQPLYDNRAVNDGLCVRHGRDPCKTAGRSSHSAAANGLFRRLSRLTQVDVHVDKTRRDDEPPGVQDDCIRRIYGRRNFFYNFPFNQNVANPVFTRRRVDKSALLNE